MKAKTMGNKNARRPANYVAKAAKAKKNAVDQMVQLFGSHKVIAVVNLESLPSAQLQRLRSNLPDLQIFMSKKPFIKRAIESVSGKISGIDQLLTQLSGMPALIFTNQSPFKLANTLNKSKSKAPAKAGQIAPYDLIIPAGPTSFAPGPIISELAAAGIKAGVEGGKIAVKVPATVARAGEVIKPKVADVLTKFNIQPMEIGLNLVAAYEDGIVYGRSVLSVSPETYLKELTAAAAEAKALAVEVGLATPDTIILLIGRSSRQARCIAREFGIMVPELAEELVGKAGMEAQAIESMIKFPEQG